MNYQKKEKPRKRKMPENTEERTIYKTLLSASQRGGGSESSGFARYEGSRSTAAVKIVSENKRQSNSQVWSSATSYNHDVPRLPAVNWESAGIQPSQRIPFKPHELTESRTEAQIQEYYTTVSIATQGKDVPRPMLAFSETTFPDYLKMALKAEGFTKPTPIQSIGWPCAMMGRDVVGIAETGSGKTLAYVIPAILHIRHQPPLRKYLDGPIAVVLVPTRELAQQVAEVVTQYGADVKVRCACIYGGGDKRAQALQLAAGAEVCVATPGRLIDMLRSQVTNFKRTTYFVLDEADQMLNQGFERQIKEIMEQVRPDRQSLLWSATWSPEVQEITKHIVTNHIMMNCGSPTTHASHNIVQIVDCCEGKERRPKLIRLFEKIIKSKDKRTLIFTDKKKTADELGYEMRALGWPIAIMHKDKSQSQREFVLKTFKSGKVPFLVATNVAARGLDIKEIGFVINYDMPKQIVDYVHRIGRTGRADKRGVAYTFFTQPNAKELAANLVRVLNQTEQDVSPQLLRVAEGMLGQVNNQRLDTSLSQS